MRPSTPVIVFASLMRPEGTTGVQAHMREFDAFLTRSGVQHEVVTPFYTWATPLLYLFILLRRFLEVCWKPAAVWLYRSGHAWLMGLRLSAMMRRYPDCVVYAQCPLSASVAMRCVRNPNQRVVLVVHFNVSQADEWIDKGMIPRQGALDRGIRQLEQATLVKLDGIIYVSHFMRTELERSVPGVSRVKSAVIPNFVSALTSKDVVARVKGRDLVCVGTLEPRKNQRYLLDILGEAKRRGHTLNVTLVGDGPDRAALAQRCAELGIADQVFFEGFQPNGRAFIPGHRLYVHVAKMENLPVVLLEALSAGVPIIAGHVGGIPEIYQEGVEGRFWPLDDVAAACDVLLDVIGNDTRLAAMCASAHARFAAAYESNAVASKLRDFILS